MENFLFADEIRDSALETTRRGMKTALPRSNRKQSPSEIIPQPAQKTEIQAMPIPAKRAHVTKPRIEPPAINPKSKPMTAAAFKARLATLPPQLATVVEYVDGCGAQGATSEEVAIDLHLSAGTAAARFTGGKDAGVLLQVVNYYRPTVLGRKAAVCVSPRWLKAAAALVAKMADERMRGG